MTGPRRRLRSALAAAGAVAALGGLGLVAIPAVAGLARATSSVAPISVRVHPTVTPDLAGTPAAPRGVHLRVVVDLAYPAGYQPPIVDRLRIWFPRGGHYEGGRYPVCPPARLAAGGPPACPPDSIDGTGVGDAMADRSPTHPRLTIVNGGQRRAYIYVVLNNPAHVAEPLTAAITPRRGRWSYELSVAIPRNLQIVAGIPIVLHALTISAGRGAWLATTSCPADHRWPWQALATFTDRQRITAHGAVACRR